MSSGSNHATLRSAGVAGLGLLAMALGNVSAQGTKVSQVICEVTSKALSKIESQDGFANALVEVAEYACNEKGNPVRSSVATVAVAMAEAVAEVVGECSGQGNAVATVTGFARAEARAQAVGRASARILTNAAICKSCKASLNAFAETVETITASAVAEASVDATIKFQRGAKQTVTVRDVQRVIENNVIDVLSSVSADIHSSSATTCSATSNVRVDVGDSFAECDVAVSASAIVEETNAVADAATTVQALACDGEGTENEVRVIAREIAKATAKAIVQAEAFCESNGGPGTIACGRAEGAITAVASATAQAFAEGLAVAKGKDCDCDLSSTLSGSEMETIMVEASTSALAKTCAEGKEFAGQSSFKVETEEALALAVAEVLATAINGKDCRARVNICAESGICVERFSTCAGPGIDGMFACCDAGDICTAFRGARAFTCVSRALVATVPTSTFDTMECNS